MSMKDLRGSIIEQGVALMQANQRVKELEAMVSLDQIVAAAKIKVLEARLMETKRECHEWLTACGKENADVRHVVTMILNKLTEEPK